MAPKYRGDSEDWLDSTQRKTFKKKRIGVEKKERDQQNLKSKWLEPHETNAVVISVFPKLCRVLVDESKKDFLCSYRWANLIGRSDAKSEFRERAPVAVGDRVLVVDTDKTQGVIEGIGKRNNLISRPAPGKDANEAKQFHVIATNVDFLVIVASSVQPDFSPGLIDRYLIVAQQQKMTPLIVLTKCDLLPEGTLQRGPWDNYRDLGFEVFPVAAKSHQGVQKIRTRISAKTAVFCGHSGVGKTSLLRELLGESIGEIGSVNSFTGKGRHTTSASTLWNGPDNSQWIDTPGVREFGLIGVGAGDLRSFYQEFNDLNCSKHGCMHDQEPECDAKDLYRWETYRRIYHAIIEDNL